MKKIILLLVGVASLMHSMGNLYMSRATIKERLPMALWWNDGKRRAFVFQAVGSISDDVKVCEAQLEEKVDRVALAAKVTEYLALLDKLHECDYDGWSSKNGSGVEKKLREIQARIKE